LLCQTQSKAGKKKMRLEYSLLHSGRLFFSATGAEFYQVVTGEADWLRMNGTVILSEIRSCEGLDHG